MLLRKRKKSPVQHEKEPFDFNSLTVQDLFAPDGLVINYDSLRLGLGHVRLYAVQALPRQLQAGWFDEILNIGDVDVTVYIAPAPDHDVIRRLERKENQAATRYIQDQGRRTSLA
ncbi:MAG: hypothetical protein ACPLRH_00185, partial [Desulfotomaculales bacterium]